MALLRWFSVASERTDSHAFVLDPFKEMISHSCGGNDKRLDEMSLSRPIASPIPITSDADLVVSPCHYDATVASSSDDLPSYGIISSRVVVSRSELWMAILFSCHRGPS